MSYRDRAASEIATERPAATMLPLLRRTGATSQAMLSRTPPDATTRAAAARAYAVGHLEELHAQVREQFTRRGIGYHLAATPAEAIATIRGLLGDAKRVAKSKSMVSEEVGLTHALRADGLDILETDIGEYIVDIEGRGPSHITAPAIHLNRSRIRDLLLRAGLNVEDDDPTRLSRAIRDIVGAYFKDCDAGITGANAVVASSGRLTIVENEGNVSLGVSHPKLHIVITGYEKVVADEAGALAILEVLAPSATGQPLTAFTHFVADPMPGQVRHVVFVDNGRSRIAREPRYRDVLRCIKCGACMNGCPVYRAAGGLSYGSAYMGPIGAVLSPLLWPDGRFADLPFASSLCGRCTEVCPVGIPLHRMLLDLRADAVDAGHAASGRERAAWKAWSFTYSGATSARTASTIARLALRGLDRLKRAPGGSRMPTSQLPEVVAAHDGSRLAPLHPPEPPPVFATPPVDEPPGGVVALFRARAGELGATLAPSTKRQRGDHRVVATAAIASTGSVVLTGAAARARRAILGATRLVVSVDPATVVRYPSDLGEALGDGEVLILTGASRTSDIEKIIVRGIHGALDLTIEMPDEDRPFAATEAHP